LGFAVVGPQLPALIRARTAGGEVDGDAAGLGCDGLRRTAVAGQRAELEPRAADVVPAAALGEGAGAVVGEIAAAICEGSSKGRSAVSG